MDIWEELENFNILRSILFEWCKKKLQGGGQLDPHPQAGIGSIRFRALTVKFLSKCYFNLRCIFRSFRLGMHFADCRTNHVHTIKYRVSHETWQKQDDLKIVFNLWIYLRHSVVNPLNMFDFWNNNHKILLVLGFLKCGLPFLRCHFFQRYWEFHWDLIFFLKPKFVEIWTKSNISPVILRAQKRQTTFWKYNFLWLLTFTSMKRRTFF